MDPCDALDRLKRAMIVKGMQFQPRANIRTIEYAWPMVSAGVGAALLPDWQEIRQSDDFVLRPIEGEKLIKQIGSAHSASRVEEPQMDSVICVCKAAGS